MRNCPKRSNAPSARMGARVKTTSSMISVIPPPMPQPTITPNSGSRNAVTSSSRRPWTICCTQTPSSVAPIASARSQGGEGADGQSLQRAADADWKAYGGTISAAETTIVAASNIDTQMAKLRNSDASSSHFGSSHRVRGWP